MSDVKKTGTQERRMMVEHSGCVAGPSREMVQVAEVPHEASMGRVAKFQCRGCGSVTAILIYYVELLGAQPNDPVGQVGTQQILN